MGAEYAVQVENVSKTYGQFKAVDEISFTVKRGEVFALLGPNGAGKSTTIRMMLDIIRPDTGRIAILGGPMSEATKDRIGYLPEERGLYKNVPVLDMMVYLGKLKGMNGASARQRAVDLLEQLELGEHGRKKVSELSKGMQQKVQFAVTVMHQPELIIIDEPFSGLDPINRLAIKNLLLSLRDAGGAIVMSTHQMNQVEEMADRLFMISKGQQKLYGDVDSIRRDFALHAIIIKGEGDWASLRGVHRIENGNNGRDGTLLFLEDDVTSDEVLTQIAQSSQMRIERFEMAIPSLDDIFIRVAGEASA